MSFSRAHLKETDAYFTAWSEFHRRRIYMWTTCLTAMLGVGMVAAAVTEDWATWMTVAILLPVFAFSGLRHLFWHCPRCDRPYLTRYFGWFYLDLETALGWKCRHCGLPRWAPHDPDSQADHA